MLARTMTTSVDDQDGETQEAVDAAWDAEILRRLEDIKLGRAELVPWEQVVRRINERYGWTSK
ncbi:MAG: addiction module protein [Roseimicrobium sp.]